MAWIGDCHAGLLVRLSPSEQGKEMLMVVVRSLERLSDGRV